MRLLTPSEQREIEQLKKHVEDVRQYQGEHSTKYFSITVEPTNADFWLNILDMVLQTQDALKVAWQKSDNPIINLRG